MLQPLHPEHPLSSEYQKSIKALEEAKKNLDPSYVKLLNELEIKRVDEKREISVNLIETERRLAAAEKRILELQDKNDILVSLLEAAEDDANNLRRAMKTASDVLKLV